LNIGSLRAQVNLLKLLLELWEDVEKSAADGEFAASRISRRRNRRWLE
jgi:hypothetical protein